MQGALVTASRKNVVGMCSKFTSSNSLFALSRLVRQQSHHACFPYNTQGFLRCETSPRSYMERFISPFRNYIGTRHVSWLLRSRTRPADSNGVLEDQEDLTKAAILEKVMKGRQPTDLMLRCASLFLPSVRLQLTKWPGTILDAEGASTHTPAYDFADMIAHSRKCQDDLWSLQKVRLDCGTWVECMSCPFIRPSLWYVDRLVTFVKLTQGFLILFQPFLYGGKLSWLVLPPSTENISIILTSARLTYYI